MVFCLIPPSSQQVSTPLVCNDCIKRRPGDEWRVFLSIAVNIRGYNGAAAPYLILYLDRGRFEFEASNKELIENDMIEYWLS